MLCAAVVLPCPPLLVPEVAAGAAGELAGLRAACAAALAEAFATGPDRVVLVGAGGSAEGAPTLAPYGLAGPALGLPLALSIGSWLLDGAGWDGARDLRCVPPDAPPEDCATLGSALAAEPGRTLLVAVGDGTARRSPAAPGHLDERAAGFDAAVATALAAGDPGALLALGAGLAADLMAGGRAAWQVLAGAVGAVRVTARLLYADAPYGVGYFVSCWRPAP